MTDTPLMRIDGLTVEFPSRRGDFTAVKDFSLSVNAGEIVGVVGGSGTGIRCCCARLLG